MRYSLLSFEVENYRSFCEPQKLVFGDASMRGVTALFGPNAGGKSNIVRALARFCSSVVNSASAGWRLPYEPFLLRAGMEKRPCRFAARFASEDGLIYEYEFSFSAEVIMHERLREKSSDSSKMRTIFERDDNGYVGVTSGRSGFGATLLKKTRPDTLIVSKGREDNNPYANLVYGLASSVAVISDDSWSGGSNGPLFVNMLKNDESLREATVDFLKKCDFAIQGISVQNVSIAQDMVDALPLRPDIKSALVQSGGTTFKTLHVVRDDEQNVVDQRELDFWAQESTGTQRFFQEIVPIIDAVRRGGIIVVDEFGTSIHAELSKAVLALFRTKGDELQRAGLMFSTQNVSLMSLLGREEIFLVDKTLSEETRITPLTSLGVREREAFEKRYRAGMYGAVPIVEG